MIIENIKEFYSAIKNNKTMDFAEKYMEIEIITLSELRQTLKNNNFLICVF